MRGTLNGDAAEQLGSRLAHGLKRRKERLVLDLERLAQTERDALESLAKRLSKYRDRIRIVVPAAEEFAVLALFASYR